MPRKVFTPEFKLTAIRLAATPGAVVERVAHELGVASWTLRRWMKEHLGSSRTTPAGAPNPVLSGSTRPGRDAASPVAGEADLAARVRRLEAENTRLRMERDILKKATAFFAAEDQRHTPGKEPSK